MSSRRLTIYGNWSAYDELSDGVPLTEELAMRQFDELLRLRSHGARFDAYLMDAFWFDRDGGYREWRKPNWPNGPQRWLDACAEHGLIPGLWFTANTLCHLKPATAWLDSADANEWGLCCFHGGFLADYLDILDHWYGRGIRIFKLDFADFTAAPPKIKAELTVEEIRRKNVLALRAGLRQFRADHPDAIFMAFNGFEEKEFMDRTDRPIEKVIDLEWLDVFDSTYSGDPRPADVPAIPFWRSVDIYGDHTTRVLEASGLPLTRIDNCGFMAGPTGTCYWRGNEMWKGMLLLTLARGGDLTVLYGDLFLFNDEDAQWMARAQALFEDAFAQGGAESFGGIPGMGEPYGWLVGKTLCAVVNPQSVTLDVDVPSGKWQVLFADAGYQPAIDSLASTLRLAPFQMALLGVDGPSLGVQEDCLCPERTPAGFKILEHTSSTLVVETEAGNLQVIAQQKDASGKLVRKYSGPDSPTNAIEIKIFQDGSPLDATREHKRTIWSGTSWGSATLSAQGAAPVRVEVVAADADVETIDLQIWKEI